MAEHDDDWFRKYLDAGAALGQITRARAEAFVRELMGGHEQSGDTKQRVEDFIERGRRATEELLTLVRTEVANQLNSLGVDAEQLGNQVADALRRTASNQRRTPKPDGVAPSPIPLGSGTWTAGEAAPVPEAMPDEGTAPRTAETAPATAKKAPAKEAPAKEAAVSGSAAVKKATAKKAPSKKTGTTKAAPVKATAKKTAPAKKTASATQGNASDTPAARSEESDGGGQDA